MDEHTLWTLMGQAMKQRLLKGDKTFSFLCG